MSSSSDEISADTPRLPVGFRGPTRRSMWRSDGHRGRYGDAGHVDGSAVSSPPQLHAIAPVGSPLLPLCTTQLPERDRLPQAHGCLARSQTRACSQSRRALRYPLVGSLPAPRAGPPAEPIPPGAPASLDRRKPVSARHNIIWNELHADGLFPGLSPRARAAAAPSPDNPQKLLDSDAPAGQTRLPY